MVFLEYHNFNNVKMWSNSCHGHFRYELQQQPVEASIVSYAFQLCLSLPIPVLLPHLSLIFASTSCSVVYLSSITFIMLFCRVPGPGPLSFYSLLSLLGRTTNLFSCLYVLLSAYTLLYSSSLSWVFFSFFSF